MKDFSIAMALVDYIPVVLFGLGAANLMQCLYNKMTKASFSLFAAGSINVFMAGFLKATYKLLYAANICDFEPLNAMFFPPYSAPRKASRAASELGFTTKRTKLPRISTTALLLSISNCSTP